LKHAIDMAPLGELADPHAIVRLAVAAEQAGWDGLSIWDGTGNSMGTAAPDPFVALAAVAAATSRLRLIASVIALPRRRPQLIAQSAATLDRLSNGRLTLGLGSGGDPGDFEPFGESYERAPRVALLDEGLPLIDAWLRGQKVDHAGPAYTVRGATIGPACIQRPRPPIWLGGMRPGGLRRAARWDGWICIGVSDDGATMTMTPARLAEMVGTILAERELMGMGAAPFDVAVFGYSEPDQPDLVPSIGEAGATWWLESLSLMRGDVDALLARVGHGPPTAG
jgi:alkanesulfonate monooxygenase SsuD/methylene tetrahydromethanopterin reductase-like flavin-dependent oxidoreductase (luciferase family)